MPQESEVYTWCNYSNRLTIVRAVGAIYKRIVISLCLAGWRYTCSISTATSIRSRSFDLNLCVVAEIRWMWHPRCVLKSVPCSVVWSLCQSSTDWCRQWMVHIFFKCWAREGASYRACWWVTSFPLEYPYVSHCPEVRICCQLEEVW